MPKKHNVKNPQKCLGLSLQIFFSQMEYLRVKHNRTLSECGDAEDHSLSVYNKALISRGFSPSGRTSKQQGDSALDITV